MLHSRFAAIALCAALGIASLPAQTSSSCNQGPWTLWAGQTNNVGTVTVSNDLINLYVTFTLNYQDAACPEGDVDATFGTLHLWVGDTDPTGPLSTMPATANGTPIPGQFPYSADASGKTTHTFTIPLSELGITNVTNACNKTLYVVPHAEVNYTCPGGRTGGDTAFGGDKPGTGPRWWYYFSYKICCDFGDPPVPSCDTAYAKGGYVWTTQPRSNPEQLPSLKLTQNRWGWAIKLTTPTLTSFPIWAGAGLNNTGNGTLVGTLLVSWNGTNVSFTYQMNSGFKISELHFYAGDDAPTTIAPGQYGYTKYFDPAVSTWTDSLPLADLNSGGVWLVAHAVVCTTNT